MVFLGAQHVNLIVRKLQVCAQVIINLRLSSATILYTHPGILHVELSVVYYWESPESSYRLFIIGKVPSL